MRKRFFAQFIFTFFLFILLFPSSVEAYCPHCVDYITGDYICTGGIEPEGASDGSTLYPDTGGCDGGEYCTLSGTDSRWYCRACGELNVDGTCSGDIQNEDEGQTGCNELKVGLCGALGGCASESDVCVYELNTYYSGHTCMAAYVTDYDCSAQEEIVCDIDMAVKRECGVYAGCPTDDYVCEYDSSFRPVCTYDPDYCNLETSKECSVPGLCGPSAGCLQKTQMCTSVSLGGDVTNVCQENASGCPDDVNCGGLHEECCVPNAGVAYGDEVYCEGALVCNSVSGKCENDIMDDSDPVIPGGVKIFKRRPGQPYDGYLLQNFTGLMQGLFKILYPTAIIIDVAFLLKGAYGFMVSEGDPQKVKEAQTQLSSASIGALFVLLSATILRIIISNILGVSTNL